MHRGYVPVWRKLKDSTFYRDSEAVHLWLHILFEAQHTEKKEWYKGKEIVLQEGQFTTGRKRLASETGISESKIQRLLKKFEKCHMIEQQTNSANRLISIVNYKSHKASEQQTNNKRTIGEQQVNNVRTHSKNVNNVNNGEECNNTTQNEFALDTNDVEISFLSFDQFFDMYGKRVDKKKAEAKYKKVSESDRALIKEQLPLYVESTPDKQFRKSPSVYLNGEHWHDEIVESVAQPQKQSYADKEAQKQADSLFAGTELELLGLDIIKGQGGI